MNTPAIPLVSVIVTCYNYGKYLAEAVESIIRQSYTNWELIIVDDGSTDDTAAVANRLALLDQRIRYHYQRNQGPSAARNTGLTLASGKYIQLLDADDLLAQDKVRIQVEFLEKNQDYTLVFGDVFSFVHSEKREKNDLVKFELSVAPVTLSGVELLLHMAEDNMFLISAPVYRRSMHELIGGFKPGLSHLEDWFYWYKGALYNQKFFYYNHPDVVFFVRSHGANSSGSRYKMWGGRVRARKEIIGIIRKEMAANAERSAELAPVLKKNIRLLEKETVRFELLYGRPLAAVPSLASALFSSPRPFSLLYESAWLLKERALGRA